MLHEGWLLALEVLFILVRIAGCELSIPVERLSLLLGPASPQKTASETAVPPWTLASAHQEALRSILLGAFTSPTDLTAGFGA